MVKQPKKVSNASVRLLADHQINGVIRKKGTTLHGYSGALSSNMRVIKQKRVAEPEPEAGGGAGAGNDPGAGGGNDPENGGAGSGNGPGAGGGQ